MKSPTPQEATAMSKRAQEAHDRYRRRFKRRQFREAIREVNQAIRSRAARGFHDVGVPVWDGVIDEVMAHFEQRGYAVERSKTQWALFISWPKAES